MEASSLPPRPGYRPWPPPRAPWVMAQRWHDLLFAHWRVPVAALSRRVPPGLPIDTYDGEAWLGVVPFHMSNVRPRRAPALPWLSAFPELNVRTYVTLDGRPGVYFFSLDAERAVAVALARLAAHLPYFTADMSVQRDGAWVHYASRRTDHRAPRAELIASYRPIGPAAPPPTGSLADWLTHRFCLYAADRRGGLYRLEIDHRPWPLQPAEAEFQVNSMAAAHGIQLPGEPPLLHFARRMDMRAWWPERVG